MDVNVQHVGTNGNETHNSIFSAGDNGGNSSRLGGDYGRTVENNGGSCQRIGTVQSHDYDIERGKNAFDIASKTIAVAARFLTSQSQGRR